ncbi:MAG TPA: DUF721 domain-containing protein [Rhizomicrobium sp.]|jgi:hypothetical protein|nr:DUF721 domain-containing protein [Rhizomicrobium sp.]
MARTLKDIQDAAPQRHNRPTAIGTDAKSAGSSAFVRAGFSDPTLVLRWSEIAGPDIARLAQPLKFAQGPSGGTLTLRTAPGAALFLSYEKRALCARINSYLGREAVVQLKFSQGEPLLPRTPAPKPQKALGPLPPADPSRRYQGPEGLAKALQALARRRTASY